MAQKARRKKSKKVKSRKSVSGADGRTSLASLPTEALAAELRRRQSLLPKLEKLATSLRAELAKVDAQIAALGGRAATPAKPGATGGRRTHRGQPTVGEQIVEILSARGGVMSPREIGDALGARLSRAVNSSFLVQISLTLSRLVKQGRVEKTGRGQYSAKGAAVASNG